MSSGGDQMTEVVQALPLSTTVMPPMDWVPSAQNTIRKRKWDADAAIDMAMIELNERKAKIDKLQHDLDTATTTSSTKLLELEQQQLLNTASTEAEKQQLNKQLDAANAQVLELQGNLDAARSDARVAVELATAATQTVDATKQTAATANEQILAFTTWLRDSPEEATIAIPPEISIILMDSLLPGSKMQEMYNQTYNNPKWESLRETSKQMSDSGLYTSTKDAKFVADLEAFLRVNLPINYANTVTMPIATVAGPTQIFTTLETTLASLKDPATVQIINNLTAAINNAPTADYIATNAKYIAIYLLAFQLASDAHGIVSQEVFDALTNFYNTYQQKAGDDPGLNTLMYNAKLADLNLLRTSNPELFDKGMHVIGSAPVDTRRLNVTPTSDTPVARQVGGKKVGLTLNGNSNSNVAMGDDALSTPLQPYLQSVL